MWPSLEWMLVIIVQLAHLCRFWIELKVSAQRRARPKLPWNGVIIALTRNAKSRWWQIGVTCAGDRSDQIAVVAAGKCCPV